MTNHIEQADREAVATPKPFFDRPVSYDMARQAAINFIDQHFKNPRGKGVMTSIPVQEMDDDIVLMDYLRATQSQAAEIEKLRVEIEALKKPLMATGEDKSLAADQTPHLG